MTSASPHGVALGAAAEAMWASRLLRWLSAARRIRSPLRFVFLVSSFVAGTAIVVAGCADSGATGRAEPSIGAESVRVMVRFRPGTPDPADPAFLASLASRSGIAGILFIRPMSGGAYVVEVGCEAPSAVSEDDCATALARLRSTEPVVEVEVDARVRHQPARRPSEAEPNG